MRHSDCLICRGIGRMHISEDSKKTIFFVTDDKEASSETIELLKVEGFCVKDQLSRQNTILMLPDCNPDLIMLDLASTETDELALCRVIRSKYQGPLIILSKRYSDVNHILGLVSGADDMIGRPFNPLVLFAKINFLIKRFDNRGNNNDTVEGLTIDVRRREVFLDGISVNLTTIEFDILSYLYDNAGKVVSRNDIHLALYKREHNGYDRSIDIYISRIRQKIGDAPVTPKYLKTVRGAGYLFAGRK